MSEKINTSVLDDLIKQAFNPKASDIILKWSFPEKIAACGILSQLSNDETTKELGNACLMVARFILGVDMEYIDRRLKKIIENFYDANKPEVTH